jgi:hypothetical protein
VAQLLDGALRLNIDDNVLLDRHHDAAVGDKTKGKCSYSVSFLQGSTYYRTSGCPRGSETSTEGQQPMIIVLKSKYLR